MLKILAFDPGQKNCSFALLQHNPTSRTLDRTKLLCHGLLPSEVTNLNLKSASQLSIQIKTLQELLGQLKAEYSPTHLILERYMTRGFGGGSNTTEVINFLIGTITSYNVASTKLIGASTWKNEVKRQRIKQGLEPQLGKHTCNKTEVYEGFETERGVLPVSAHQVDACYIAMYGLYALLKIKPFQDFDFQSWDIKIKKTKIKKFRGP